MKRSILTFFISVCFYSWCYCYPTCRNENGESVDWFVLYKLPKIKNHPNDKIARGIAYLYITSESTKQGWQFATYPITHTKSIPGRTLSVNYSTKTRSVKDICWLFYSDQPPNQNFTRSEGHTKGIIIGGEKGGFWMVHSVPKFPITNASSYMFPKSGTVYGQSFLCITMRKENLDEVGDQLITNCANVFDSRFTSKLNVSYPTLVKAANKERRSVKKSKKIFYSLFGNVPFNSFAKSNKFEGDLYSKWVAEDLFTELYVETWLHEDKLSSDCNETYAVHNVKRISVKILKCEFNNYKDHSKYAVSANGEKPWVCIGDINRASSQFIRGGGTVCVQNEDLWLGYHRIINAIEPCPKPSNQSIIFH